MKMAKFSKDKGARVERYFVNKLNDAGIAAKRVPLSGAMRDYKDDLTLPWLGLTQRGEVKARADGFKEIYKWLDPVRVLFLKANRKDGLAVMRLYHFSELLKWANIGLEYYAASHPRVSFDPRLNQSLDIAA